MHKKNKMNPSGCQQGQMLLLILPFNTRKDQTNEYGLPQFGKISRQPHPYLVHSISPEYIRLIQFDSIKFSKEGTPLYVNNWNENTVIEPETSIYPRIGRATEPRYDKIILVANIKELNNELFYYNRTKRLMETTEDKPEEPIYKKIINEYDEEIKKYGVQKEDRIIVNAEEFKAIYKAWLMQHNNSLYSCVERSTPKQKIEEKKKLKEKIKEEIQSIPDTKNKYKRFAQSK